jgi:hypothetical protein
MMTPTDSPECPPPRRVALSFLAPALVNRFDAHGRLRRGLVVGLAGTNAHPLVLWDDEENAIPIPPEWLELAGDD